MFHARFLNLLFKTVSIVMSVFILQDVKSEDLFLQYILRPLKKKYTDLSQNMFLKIRF